MKTQCESSRLPAHVRRRVAVAAEADPRTVDRVCAGLPVRGAVGERVAKALAGLGLTKEARHD